MVKQGKKFKSVPGYGEKHLNFSFLERDFRCYRWIEDIKALPFKHVSGENMSLLVEIWFSLAIFLSIERIATFKMVPPCNVSFYGSGKRRLWGHLAKCIHPLQGHNISKRLTRARAGLVGSVVFYHIKGKRSL